MIPDIGEKPVTADEWLGRIQKRTGQTREAVEKAVKDSTKSSCCS